MESDRRGMMISWATGSFSTGVEDTANVCDNIAAALHSEDKETALTEVEAAQQAEKAEGAGAPSTQQERAQIASQAPQPEQVTFLEAYRRMYLIRLFES